ncbi:drug resistance transporter, EmrB/QacA subfamily [Xylanimonas cellulosilytica DSM 15894]|uniref:Drug resistance transporter, EmrB/QacA subfamily n=1 Tax=Xylanimonas cellulosilytica (strain DSM 15894 / JCM 12276 / CECT 5975 / KCTC 9989 / LMG 20990 / NBRC 107835 / XIL07) TaxID=446471 RepID=D1BRU4_XYLCX|nr:DHA2 family efflux MFS transporter permease subunit [Xylanimonas cellulosilytica]ACZ32360.1 drug resistance transporter, EmrB/QacA subfamily [Xylanimonas cellulosilytica DSM 15894]
MDIPATAVHEHRAPDAASQRLPRAHFTAIALLLASTFVVILNETTMSVALPPIMADFGVTAATGQWLTTVFMLTMAVVIPATGFLLNRYGTRFSYLLAMALFTAGTALAVVAPAFGILVLARVVQATGTAIMMPLLMTTVMNLVPPRRRGKVMGNVSLVISAAPALGPTLSGAVLGPLGWRGVFGVVLPISIASLVVGAVLIRDVSEREHKRLDVTSLLLAAVAFGGLVYGLSSLGEAVAGDVPVPPAVPLAVGAAFLGLFVWRQLALQRVDDALLDLRVFASRGFSTGLGTLAVAMLAMFGSFIVLPLVLQRALGLEPLVTGLLVLPGGLLMGLLGPVVGNLYDRVGPRPLVIPGLALATVAFVGLAAVQPSTAWWFVLAAHVVLSLGLALMFTPLFTTALGSLTPHLYSHGSAAVGTVQQLAGAAGTAMFIALLTARSTSLADAGAHPAVALTGGARLAFLVGAAVMAASAILAVTLRKPEMSDDVPVTH